MIFRILTFVFLVTPAWVALAYYDSAVQPDVSTHLAIQAVNGNNQDATNLRVQQKTAFWPVWADAGWTLLVGAACFGGPIKRVLNDLPAISLD